MLKRKKSYREAWTLEEQASSESHVGTRSGTSKSQAVGSLCSFASRRIPQLQVINPSSAFMFSVMSASGKSTPPGV